MARELPTTLMLTTAAPLRAVMSAKLGAATAAAGEAGEAVEAGCAAGANSEDRKSTRLNSSHLVISYAVFCLKKKKSASTAGPRHSAPPSHAVNIIMSLPPAQ